MLVDSHIIGCLSFTLFYVAGTVADHREGSSGGDSNVGGTVASAVGKGFAQGIGEAFMIIIIVVSCIGGLIVFIGIISCICCCYHVRRSRTSAAAPGMVLHSSSSVSVITVDTDGRTDTG